MTRDPSWLSGSRPYDPGSLALKSWSLPWRQYAIPAAILVAGLVFTTAAVVTTEHFVHLRDTEHFERLQSQALRAIDHSFDSYASILRAAASDVETEGKADPDRFARFLAGAGVPDAYPGLRLIGLSQITGGADRAGAIRKSTVLTYFPTTAADPRQTLGNDLYAEPMRREAMDAARTSGQPRLSNQLTSFHEPGKGPPHLLMFYPLSLPDAAAPGGKRFAGWVYASFRNQGFFQSILADLGYLNEIKVKVYDGAETPQRLLYASPEGPPGRNDLNALVSHSVAGRRWLVRFTASPGFDGWPANTTVLPIAAAGLAITLSLTVGSWLQSVGLQRAQRAQALAKAARDRSELLMNEVNHRVANSLQLVSTLVSMQADQVGDVAARQALEETRNRIMAVARVHQRLYASGEVARVALKPYLESLMAGLGAGAPRGVRLTLLAAEISVATDLAVSIGVVTAELITNALKYAYPGGEGEVRVSLAGDAGEAVLSVEDDGVGVGAEAKGAAAPASGLGMHIVRAMTQGLRGELSVDGAGRGHRVRLRFPVR